MSNKFLPKLIIGLAFVAAAVLWLLSVLDATKEMFAFFNLSWAVVLASGVSGITIILGAVFKKTDVVTKKFTIFFGIGLLIVTVFALVTALALPSNIVLPIIAVVVSVGILIAMIAVGGKKWDSGENQKVGYKNYYERKKEEEKKKQEEDGE